MTTDSMVERVARAICHSSLTRDVLALNEPDSTDPGQLAVALAGVLSKEVNKCWGEFEDDARAAIEAVADHLEVMGTGTDEDMLAVEWIVGVLRGAK